MRIRNLIVAIFCLAIAVPGIASAEKPADSGFKVTGGGQIITDSSAGGPGDTVGFNAQDLDDESSLARGQFQYVPRENDSEDARAEKFHGVVTCLMSGSEALADEPAEDNDDAIQPGMARFGGYIRGESTSDGQPIYFTVDVSDNGQGAEAEDDMILVRITSEPCADNPEDDSDEEAQELLRLGRGNVKIHNNPDGEAAAPAAAAALAVNALR